MSGDLNISAGGAICVDPEALRAAADRMSSAAARLQDCADLAWRGHAMLRQVPDAAVGGHLDGLASDARTVQALSDELTDDADGTRVMADAFELADLRARLAMTQVADPRAAQVMQDRIDELAATRDNLGDMATQVTSRWERHKQDGLLNQWGDGLIGTVWPNIGLFTLATMAEMRRHPQKYGLLPDGTSLSGTAPPVAVTQVARTEVVAGAPRSLTGVLSRIPKADGQIAVEKRTHRDGHVSFDLYVDGTRALADRTEPWDMGSNWDLFMDREKGASFVAVQQALKAAGARAGSEVNMNGYSQGGLDVSPLVVSGFYETGRVVLVAPPVVPLVGDDVELIHLVHTGDPVGSGLTGGGPGFTLGSPDSLTISRDATTGSEFSSFKGHLFDAYEETARQAEASGDPRIHALSDRLQAEAEDIVAVERLEFQAVRP